LSEFTTQAPGYCPSSEWIAYESNCYRVERITRSFGEAKFDCANRGCFKYYRFYFIVKKSNSFLGATVASISSKAEMEFLTNNVDITTTRNQIWIGLVKNPNTGITFLYSNRLL
jgi:hypothetical protein